MVQKGYKRYAQTCEVILFEDDDRARAGRDEGRADEERCKAEGCGSLHGEGCSRWSRGRRREECDDVVSWGDRVR